MRSWPGISTATLAHASPTTQMASSHISPNTRSTCLGPAQTVRGTHQFEIVGYSLKKGLGVGEFVRSGTFAVGGYKWSVRCYPGGFGPAHQEFVSVFVKLMSNKAKATALFDLRLIDRTTGLSHSVYRAAQPIVFDYSIKHKKCKGKRGARAFMRRSDLDGSAYVRDDRLTIECVVDVVDETWVPQTVDSFVANVPPSDLSNHLGKLLEQQDGVDITFDVRGEAFHAHKIVLAMRSPVFMAEFYGPMKEKGMRRITIDDMQPLVFKALLHFIYSDTLLLPDDLGADDYREMIRHLLEAADRYAMERLKVICELILCRIVDGKTVATTLALADQHYCNALKDVCVQFMSVGLEG